MYSNVALIERPPAAVSPRETGRPPQPYSPELDILRLGSDAALAGLLPRMRFDLRVTPAEVSDIVNGPRAGEFCSPGGALDPEVAAALGATLGAWHHGAARHVGEFRPIQIGTSVPAVAAGDPLLRASLGALRREWAPTTIVHGDCRASNAYLAIDPDGCGGARAVLIGWSRSGAGDPAWDLGCLMADILIAGIDGASPAVTEVSLSAALAAYGRAAGAETMANGFARRVALSVVARLVDVSAVAGEPDKADEELLDLGRSVAAWLPTWTQRIDAWLDCGWSAERRARAAHPAGSRLAAKPA